MNDSIAVFGVGRVTSPGKLALLLMLLSSAVASAHITFFDSLGVPRSTAKVETGHSAQCGRDELATMVEMKGLIGLDVDLPVKVNRPDVDYVNFEGQPTRSYRGLPLPATISLTICGSFLAPTQNFVTWKAASSAGGITIDAEGQLAEGEYQYWYEFATHAQVYAPRRQIRPRGNIIFSSKEFRVLANVLGRGKAEMAAQLYANTAVGTTE